MESRHSLVTNLEDSQPKCQGAAEAYHLSTVYAMETLNFGTASQTPHTQRLPFLHIPYLLGENKFLSPSHYLVLY